MQKKLLVSLLVSLALSVPAGYAVYLLTDSDFLSPGILRLMQALAVLLLIFIWGEFALLVRDARRNAHLSVDGGKALRLNMGDVATIKKSNLETKLIRLKDCSFYDVVRAKFQK